VGSNNDHWVGHTELIAVGNRSHNIFKLFSGSKKVSSSINLAALPSSGLDDTS
jgi:hypothetical protein